MVFHNTVQFSTLSTRKLWTLDELALTVTGDISHHLIFKIIGTHPSHIKKKFINIFLVVYSWKLH